MNECRVDSWSQLPEELFANSWNVALSRYRSRLAFRGLSDAGETTQRHPRRGHPFSLKLLL